MLGPARAAVAVMLVAQQAAALGARRGGRGLRSQLQPVASGTVAALRTLGSGYSPSGPPTSPLQQSKRVAEFFAEEEDATKELHLVERSRYSDFVKRLSDNSRAWLSSLGGRGKVEGRWVLLPTASGEPHDYAFINNLAPAYGQLYATSGLPKQLSKDHAYDMRRYNGAALSPESADRAALGWALGCYSFKTYKGRAPFAGSMWSRTATPRAPSPAVAATDEPSSTDSGEAAEEDAAGEAPEDDVAAEEEPPPPGARMVWPAECNRDTVMALARSTYFVRDLINTPALDMGPAHLEAEAAALAEEFGANFSSVVGDELLEHNYPQIHAVGRAAEPGREPRLIKLAWGEDESDPLVYIVGKGVCFDTGGLNIKTGPTMKEMKKDMAGGAQALGLAMLIMATNLRVRLRVLVPAVENSVGGNAIRPGDVITSRNGLTTEITNTDAEGRLVLADALAEAAEEGSDLCIDFATLTGAARVALGGDIPAVLTNKPELGTELQRAGDEVQDPVWPLPLHRPYRKDLNSNVADLRNSPGTPGGAIMAALYLYEFTLRVGGGYTPNWLHLDFNGARLQPAPGRPLGGDAQGMRAVHEMLRKRYGTR